MDRIDKIINNDIYKEHLKKIEKLEIDRIYCHHDIVHFLDVARIGTILANDENIFILRDVIYAAALLHDIGRDIQYLEGTEHEKASGLIAPEILENAGYSSDEIDTIVDAIIEHGNESVKDEKNLRGILYRADKLSRKCYCCNASDSCHKAIYKRNARIVI